MPTLTHDQLAALARSGVTNRGIEATLGRPNNLLITLTHNERNTMKETTEINLTPDPANPNRMDAETKAMMAKSLAEFGDLGGIVLNRRTGMLVGGHQRADVLRDGKLTVTDLQEPEPDGTVARGHLVCNGRRYSVRVVDWAEDKAHAALLAANKYGRRGQDDAALLKDLLEELDAGQTTDTGQLLADLTGFDAAERERLATQYHVEDGNVDASGKQPGNPKSTITFPPRVWLTQRTAIIAELSKIVQSYGGEAEWAE